MKLVASARIPQVSDFRLVLQRLADGKTLDQLAAASAFRAILEGDATEDQTAAFLQGLATRGETVDELIGVVTVLRKKMRNTQAVPQAVDICGTGGDGRGMFNVSTAAAFVAAGAGAIVAKHGNKASSSPSGSADVLAALGVTIDIPPKRAHIALERAGIAFLFAPTYHPVLAHIAPVRKSLGIRSIVNLAAPLANPLQVRRQVIGVARSESVPVIAGALMALGTDHALIVHGDYCGSGIDEITTTGSTQIVEIVNGAKTAYAISPEQFGIRRVRPNELSVSAPEESAAVIRRVLGGEKPSPHRDITALNAAAVLFVAGIAKSLDDGFTLAVESIDSGRAAGALDKLIAATKR